MQISVSEAKLLAPRYGELDLFAQSVPIISLLEGIVMNDNNFSAVQFVKVVSLVNLCFSCTFTKDQLISGK